jgi:hypothetical protein
MRREIYGGTVRAKIPHIVSVKMDPNWMPTNTKGVKGGRVVSVRTNHTYVH